MVNTQATRKFMKTRNASLIPSQFWAMCVPQLANILWPLNGIMSANPCRTSLPMRAMISTAFRYALAYQKIAGNWFCRLGTLVVMYATTYMTIKAHIICGNECERGLATLVEVNFTPDFLVRFVGSVCLADFVWMRSSCFMLSLFPKVFIKTQLRVMNKEA